LRRASPSCKHTHQQWVAAQSSQHSTARWSTPSTVSPPVFCPLTSATA
jgi:hypothetical protein